MFVAFANVVKKSWISKENSPENQGEMEFGTFRR